MRSWAISVVLALATVCGVDCFGSCNIKPQPNLIPAKLQGTWYLLKWKIPPSFQGSPPSTHYTWYVTLDQLSGTLHVLQTGSLSLSALNEKITLNNNSLFRSGTAPHDCFERPATLTPFYAPGYYRWKTGEERVVRADTMVVETDYTSYLVMFFCLPSFRPGCEVKVDVYTRSKTPDPRLINYLDRVIVHRVCQNPRTFSFTMLESLGYPTCPAPRRRRKY